MKSRPERRSGMRWVVAVATCTLNACTVGPDYVRPDVSTPTHFKGQVSNPPPEGSWKEASPQDARIPAEWWLAYGDEELNALESKVPLTNQTLAARYASFQRAREQITVDRSQLFPVVGISADSSTNRVSSHRPLLPPGTDPYYKDLSLTAQVSWELDVWGSIRRTVEATRATAQASAAELADTRLSIQAELALDYFQLRGVDSQLKLLEDTAAAYRRYVDLTTRRFKAGLASAVDMALAQTQLDQTIAQATDLDVARAQYENAIATLVGTPASDFSLARKPLEFVAPDIPKTLPSALLERRPDVAEAERQAAAANARIGVAQAAFYPSISISSSGGYESTGAATWLQGPSILWALGASAAETLFDAGRRRAVKAQAIDDFDASTAQYRERVLEAFQEVEDSLAGVRTLGTEAAVQQRVIADATRSLSLSTKLYTKGLSSYLQVITTQAILLSNQRAAVDIEARQATASVRLFKALGGGWDSGEEQE